MTKHTQMWKHCSAKDHRIKQRRAINVFNDVGAASPNQHFADGLNQTRPLVPVSVSLGKVGIRLAWRRGMDGVKRSHELKVEFQRVGLDEGKRIVRLRLIVHADDLKARSTVSDASAPSAAEQIEQPGLSSE
jgi:hypothetical protein